MKKLKFKDLKLNKKYRVLHGGEKDHGYTYIKEWNYLNDTYNLVNITKNKISSLDTKSLIFVEVDEKFRSYPTLDFKVEFTSKSIVVGCQTIDAFSAQLLANDILEHFGSK